MLPLALAMMVVAAGDSEVLRVQEHLRGAQAVLAQRELAGLTSQQRTLRALNEARLAAYLEAGEFPKNDLTQGAVPIFRDREGTLCAVGALLWESGEHDLVEHIVATRNTATVMELADEPGLARWLETQGLTLTEAARIQPTYKKVVPTFKVVTPSRGVPANACSREVRIELLERRPPEEAYVYSSLESTEFFADDHCTQLLPRVSRSFLFQSSNPVFFREAQQGKLSFVFGLDGYQDHQSHEILAPGATPTPRCSTTFVGPLLLLSVCLLRSRRLHRR